MVIKPSDLKLIVHRCLWYGVTMFPLLVVFSWLSAVTAVAQQVLADGTTETASGVIDTGMTGGTAGTALRAINGGVIQSFEPLTIITGGANAIGVQALSGSSINLYDGTLIHTTGSGADGIVASGTNSLVTGTGIDILTENVGYGLIAGTNGRIELSNSTIRALLGTGVATFSSGVIVLENSSVETQAGIGLWVNPGSTINGNGLSVTSAVRGAVVDSGNLQLQGSTINSGAIGIQAVSNSIVELNDTFISTSGTNAHGVYLAGGSSLNMTGGMISTANTGARGIWGADGVNSAILTDAEINAVNSSAIFAWGAGGILDVDLIRSTIIGNPRALEVGNGATLNLKAYGSALTGSATAAAGSFSNLSLFDGTIWKLTGTSNVTSLINDNSLIQFSAPLADPTLLSSYKTLTTGSYSAASGNIGLNVYLDVDGSPSDRLVIDGGIATGNGGLLFANTTGSGAQTSGNGILVVDTSGGGLTDPGAFYLAGPAVAGPYEYSLFRSSLDGSGPQNWYLRSELAPNPIPDYRPEVSLYAAIPTMAAIYGRHLIDTLHERVGDVEQLAGRNDLAQGKAPQGAWLRSLGHWGHRNGEARGIYDGAPEFDYRFAALQGGVDLYKNERGQISDVAGLYVAYGHGVMDVTQNRQIETRKAGRNDFNALTLGGYWTRFSDSGWYLDSVLQGTWYDVTTKSKRQTLIGFPDQDVDGFGLAASLEGGYSIDLADGWQLQPQAQLVWQNINMHGFNDGAADIRYDDLNSLAGRIGVRAARTWQIEPGGATEPSRLASIWGRVNLWHEFAAKAQTDISSATGFVPFAANLDETWLEVGIGATAQVSKRTSLYGNVNFSSTLDGDNYAWNGKLGLRVNW